MCEHTVMYMCMWMGVHVWGCQKLILGMVSQGSINFILNFLKSHLFADIHSHHDTCVEVIGQLVEVSRFLPSTTWVLGIGLKLSCFAASTLT